MKIMKRIGAAAVAALLLAAQPVAAGQECCAPEPCCNPCTDWCDMCGDWEVGAHALYWIPIGCQFAYTINQPATVAQGLSATGRASTLKCSADWGFRVFGRYLSDCSFVGLSYQWFDSKVANSRTGDLLIIAGGNTNFNGRVTGRQTIEYQNLDVRWGKYLHRACGCNFFLFGNVRWVDLSLRRSVRGQVVNTSNTELRTEKSKLEGGAIGVGAGAEFDLWCDIGLFGEANVLGVIAERSTRNIHYQLQNAQVISATYPSDTCINPELNFKVGVNYTYTCGCWTFVGELGYEVDYFWDAFALPNTSANLLSRGTSSDFPLRCNDVGFGGLFFGGKVLF